MNTNSGNVNTHSGILGKVFTFNQNHCSRSARIGVHFQSEWVFILGQNMQMEAASLRWEDIDLKSKTITLQDTQNLEIHTLPMSDFVYGLMERKIRNKKSEFVFPAESKAGYIYEPKKAVNSVEELSGVPFTLHDLRRTFATIADSLDLPA